MQATYFPTREAPSPSESLRFSVGGDEGFEPCLNQLGAIGTQAHLVPPGEARSKKIDPRVLPISWSQARPIKISIIATAGLQEQKANQQH